MKILQLNAENVKKLKAVEIKPDGNIVELTGKNGAGKTSILDSIWWALAGKEHIQSSPIRRGQKNASIRLDLGDIIVTRTFARKDEGDYTTTVNVESKEGARFSSPQAMLDKLLDSLSLDPLEFTRLEPAKQFDKLKRFVPGVNFDEIEGLNRRDYDLRTKANRDAKEARAAAGQISLPAGLPDGFLDENEAVAELERAGQHNADIEKASASRERAAERIKEKTNEASRLRSKASELRAQADGLDKDAAKVDESAAGLQKQLDALPALPTPIDTAAVRTKIDAAKVHNQLARRRDDKAKFLAAAEKAEAESKRLTKAIEDRNEDKVKKIEAAKLPVPGMGFGDGTVLLDGVPFDQASDAEQLRASVAIAMAGNPKLRVIRVRDGSLLDENGMKLLGELADANDMQVWIERVDSSGKIGVVIEDGHVKAIEQPEPELAGASA